jgi:hypothetical protein
MLVNDVLFVAPAMRGSISSWVSNCMGLTTIANGQTLQVRVFRDGGSELVAAGL